MNLDTMKRLARGRRLSRRDFVQFALTARLSAAAAQTLFSSAVRAEPKRGGTFRIALGSGSTTDTLDPATFPDAFTGLFGWGALRSGLTEVAADGSIVPDVAESFEASQSAKKWVFNLRKG